METMKKFISLYFCILKDSYLVTHFYLYLCFENLISAYNVFWLNIPLSSFPTSLITISSQFLVCWELVIVLCLHLGSQQPHFRSLGFLSPAGFNWKYGIAVGRGLVGGWRSSVIEAGQCGCDKGFGKGKPRKGLTFVM